MKRIFVTLTVLAFAILLSVSVFATESETPKVIMPGDANADGEINIKDVVLLAQYLSGWDVQLGGDSHTVVVDEAVEPTCKTTGLTEGKHCSDCGMVLVKQQIIPTTDHDYEDTVVPPTETEKGYTLHKCKDCGNEYVDSYTNATLAKGLEYEIANGTCTITGIGTCTETELYIPDTIENCNVTAISDKAFSGQTQLTKVILPKHIQTLGQRAFYGCTGLTEFTIPASVTSVGHQIFYKCSNLETVYYNSSFSPDQDKVFLNIPSIKTVIFGNIKRIPNYVCYNSNVRDVVILDSVTSIGNSAFYNCSNLMSVTIPDSVTSIGYSAFNSCNSLLSVTIPDSVTIIGQSAFECCSSLESIVIPDSVTSIGNFAFNECSSLMSVTIHNSITIINDWVFGYCRSLVSMEIPDSITSIGSCAFEGCSVLDKIEIPDSVTSIEDSAFNGCSSLKSITIPDSVTSIGNLAFFSCSSLKNVYYGGDADNWSSISIGDDNFQFISAARYYYSVTEPTDDGNYWQYVDGVPTPW